MGGPLRRAVPQKVPFGLPAPEKPVILGARAKKPNMLPSTGPEKRCLVGHRATEWHSPDPPPARMTGPGAVRWPNKKEPRVPGTARARAH